VGIVRDPQGAPDAGRRAVGPGPRERDRQRRDGDRRVGRRPLRIVAAWLAQGLTPFDAAALAAYVHGLAGDLAAADLGEISLTAGDIVEYLPRAYRALVEARPAER